MQYTSTATPGEEPVTRRWTPSCGPLRFFHDRHNHTNWMGRLIMLHDPNPANIVKVPLDLHCDGVWYPLVSPI